MTTLTSPRPIDLKLPSGTFRAERVGDPRGPLVVCVHGLSANLRAFDSIGQHLAAEAHQVVSVDLRGRGRSEITPSGTYGIDSHAQDVLDLASALGAERFSLVGWSMGALIGIHAVRAAPDRVARLALIDHCGRMDDAAVAAVTRALDRLDVEVEAPEAYVEAIRAAGAVEPWEGLWEAYFRYELVRARRGWSPSTNRQACLEDLERVDVEEIRGSWAQLDLPVLLVRARTPLAGGAIVPESERDAFMHAVPHAQLLEVDRNHYGVMTDPYARDALAEFLR